MSTSLGLPTTLLVVQPLLHLGMPSTFSLFHNRSQFVWFCHEPFPFTWTDKALGLSPLSFLACIKWSQPSTTHFGQRCHPSRASPKRGLGWKSKIGYFPPPPIHTLCKSLNCWPTSFVLVGYRLVVLWPWYGCSTTLLFLFSFSPMLFLLLLLNFV